MAGRQTQPAPAGTMPRVLTLATALPPHRLEQSVARREVARLAAGQPHLERLLPLFDRAGVESRRLVHPPEWYLTPRSFEARNEEYAVHALDLAESAARQCIEAARIPRDAIDHLYFVTTTGLMTPSLDSLLVDRLGLRGDVRRLPLFGLGCAGGAGAMARASDVLLGCPRGSALVVSVELGSLIFSHDARTATDLVGVALFGDGAGAALIVGDEVPGDGICIRSSRSCLFPEARHLMGWRFTSDGMRLRLSRDIPSFVRERVTPIVHDFLGDSGLSIDEVTHFVLHPGGPKVMTTYCSALGVPEAAVTIARDSMRAYGNLSSAAVLVMLSTLVSSGRPLAGDTGLVLALGPGFAAEMLLLSW